MQEIDDLTKYDSLRIINAINFLEKSVYAINHPDATQKICDDFRQELLRRQNHEIE